jgi:hypothetical protein
LGKRSPRNRGNDLVQTNAAKLTDFVVDEERIIEPEDLPEGATFNGYREYDVQDLILERRNIRLMLAEYVTDDGKTIVGKLPAEYQGHYGPKKDSVHPLSASPMSRATEFNPRAA